MSAMIEELWRFGVYKRSQGRIVRQVTFAAIAIALLVGVWQLIEFLRGLGDNCPESLWPWLCSGLPCVLGGLGLWFAYLSEGRIVRQVTFFALALVLLVGGFWDLWLWWRGVVVRRRSGRGSATGCPPRLPLWDCGLRIAW